MIHAFQNAVSYLCFAVLATIACVCVFVGFRQVGRWLRANLCPVSLLVFATAAVIATCEAQKRGGEGGSGASAQPIVQSIPGAETNAKWRAHGAFEDVFYLSSSNWWARMSGGGWIDRLRIRSSGGIQAKGASGGSWTNYPPPFAQKFSLAPEANWSLPSLFWHATTPSNTLVMTWVGGLYARSHTNQVDFQVELFNDGSYDYRYADHAERFPASLPFDLDGDGLENSVDPEPETAGPDAHGTNAEWYNTVCSNVLEAVAQERDPPGGGTRSCASAEISWREGVNSNAYYFVDVVTERGPAPIYFTGDRESRLGNPVVVARAFETNRVPLLIGVDYSVTSDTPFTVSFPVDYMYPEVETNEPCRAHIRWPLNFVFTESIGASNRVYTVTVEPYDPGGVFEWGDSGGGVPMRGGSSGGGCNCVSYGVNSVWFTCSSSGTCESGCVAHGSYHLERTSFSVEGGECRCGFDDPPPDDPESSSYAPDAPPSLSITFSKQAVLFEDAFENSPGVTEPRRSTRVRLTIEAYGGARGASLWLTGENFEKLVTIDGNVVLPYSKLLSEGEVYHVSGVYEGVPQNENESEVIVSGSLVPDGQGETVETNASLAVVRLEFRPLRLAPENKCSHRHDYGIGEKVLFHQHPSMPAVTLNLTDAQEIRANGASLITWGISNVVHNMSVGLYGVDYFPKMKVVPPSGVEGYAVQSMAFGLPAGVAGGLALVQRYRILPLDVSFQDLSVEEVPCYEEIPPEGYFIYTATNVFLRSHTRAAKAGIWHTVASDNSLGNASAKDLAGYRGSLPRRTLDGHETTDQTIGWCDGGSLTWKIPFGWNKEPHAQDADPVGRFAEGTRQIFRISAGGDFRMEKLGHNAERKLDGRIFVNGHADDGILDNN